MSCWTSDYPASEDPFYREDKGLERHTPIIQAHLRAGGSLVEYLRSKPKREGRTGFDTVREQIPLPDNYDEVIRGLEFMSEPRSIL